MGFTETAVIYVLLGLVVAVAMWLSGAHSIGQGIVHLLAWPFFAPLLFGGAIDDACDAPPPTPTPTVSDPRVKAAEDQLLRAIASLDGIAEEVLAPEIARVRGLTESLLGVETRLSEMDLLLAGDEFDADRALAALRALEERGLTDDDPRVLSIHSRLRNIERLRKMRDQSREDLERAAMKMEEMSAQVLVLRFADRPEAAMVDLIREVAATIEGVSERLISAA